MGIKRIYIAIAATVVCVCAPAWAGKSTDSLVVTGGANLNRTYIDTLKRAAWVDTMKAAAISSRRVWVDSLFRLPVRNDSCMVDGALWYNEDHGSIHSCIDGKVASHSRVIFVQQNTKLCSNTVAQTSLIGTDPVHPLDSFPIRYFLLGKTHRFYVSGIYSTKTTGPGTMIVRIKTNNTVLCSTIVSLDANETDQQFKIAGFNVCVDTGATGKFRVNTGFDHTIAGVSHSDNIMSPNGGSTQSTAVKIKTDITVQFSLADVNNKIKSTMCIFEELH